MGSLCGGRPLAKSCASFCSKLSLAVGNRSLNEGAGKRSSKVSPDGETCAFAASAPAFDALPHCASVSDSGTRKQATANSRIREVRTRNTPSRQAALRQRVAPLVGKNSIRSCKGNFGSAPIIHPISQVDLQKLSAFASKEG